MHDECIVLTLRFPQKLWRIVNECQTGAIKWGLNGRTILLDYKRFQEEYLDAGRSVFKTKNITSFIRQLNLYGFRKVTSHNRDPICNSHNPNVHEFLHESFRAGQPGLLEKVCRKTGVKARCCHHARSAESRGCTGRDSNQQASRLRMCRLALTRALEQVTHEYHQMHWRDVTDVSSAASNALERRTLFEMPTYTLTR
ncbi:hypothetical protein KM043_014959 [Ampulex compressa]|nr:hypothetical protein KM043_014959 [Ampulex compressa]